MSFSLLRGQNWEIQLELNINTSAGQLGMTTFPFLPSILVPPLAVWGSDVSSPWDI